jgi:hypothetical protein
VRVRVHVHCVCMREFVDKQHIDVSFVASEVSSFDSSANLHRAALCQLHCWVMPLARRDATKGAEAQSGYYIAHFVQ